MLARTCTAIAHTGRRCGAGPMSESDYCFWHDPDHVEEAAAARKLGGHRRKREATVSGAYEFEGLNGPQDLKRLLEIACFDALALETSIARVRTIIAIVQAGAKLFEVTDLEERLEALEATLGPRARLAR